MKDFPGDGSAVLSSGGRRHRQSFLSASSVGRGRGDDGVERMADCPDESVLTSWLSLSLYFLCLLPTQQRTAEKVRRGLKEGP